MRGVIFVIGFILILGAVGSSDLGKPISHWIGFAIVGLLLLAMSLGVKKSWSKSYKGRATIKKRW